MTENGGENSKMVKRTSVMMTALLGQLIKADMKAVRVEDMILGKRQVTRRSRRYVPHAVTIRIIHFPRSVFSVHKIVTDRSLWPRGLRRRSASARLLGLWVRIPPGAWMFVLCLL